MGTSVRWCVLVMILGVLMEPMAMAATYYLTTAGVGAAQTPGNWNTGGIGGGGAVATNFTTSGDIFIVSTGQSATSNGTVTFAAGVTLQILGTGTLNITGNGATFTINGTIIFTGTSATQLTLAGSGSGQTFTLGSGATLKTMNSNGVSGTNCSLPATATKATVTLNTAANYEFNGTAAQGTTGLPTTVATLTINNPAGVTLGGATTVTTLTIGNVTSNSMFSDGGFILTSTGTLNLTSGTFKLGSATVGTAFPAFATRNIAASTTVEYASGVAQTVSVTPSYQNLTFSGAGTKTTAAGTLTIGGNWTVASTTALNTNNTAVALTGSLTINAVTVTAGSGAIGIGGNWTNNGGTFTAGTSTVNLNGAGAQTIGGTTACTFSTLKVNNAVGITLGFAQTTTTLTIGDITASSIFSDGGFVLTSTGTLNLTSGTYKLGSATVGTTFPAFVTRNISSGTTVEYASGVAQTVSVTPSYQNLTFSGAGTKTTAAGTLTIGGNWTVGSTTALNTNNTIVNLTGSLTMTTAVTQGTGAISVGGNWTNNGGTFTAGAGGTIFNGSGAQAINGSTATTFINLTLINSAGLTNTTTTTTVTGTLTLTSGAYTLSSGLTLGTGATVTRGDGSLSAVPTFGTTVNLQYANTGTINTGPELPTAATVLNNLTINNSAAVTLAASPQVNGTLTLTAGTLAASTFNITMGGVAWTNNGGTFTPGSGTVNFNSTTAAQAINGTAATQTFNNITAAKTAQILSVGASTTTLILNGTMTLTSGTFQAGTATTINVAGNWTNNGTFTAGTSTVTMNGTTSQFIGGTASTTFNNLTIAGAADTSAANYKTVQTTMNVTGALTINSGNTLDLGTLTPSTIAGGTNSGKIRWSGSNKYVAGAGLTEFYGTSATTIAAGANYGNIVILGSGTNTIIGSVTVLGGDAAIGITVNSNLTVTGALTVTGMDLINNGAITNNGTIAVQ